MGTTAGGTAKLAWAEAWADQMGYNCFAPWQLSAYSTYAYWKNDSVLVFAGHGVTDYSTGTGVLGGGLLCIDTAGTKAYILAEDKYYPSRANGTYSYADPHGGWVTRETYFIKNYSGADIDDCLVVLFIGCGTGLSGPRFGNLLSYARARGVDCAVGFTGMNWLEAEGVFGMGFIKGARYYNYPIDSPQGYGAGDLDLMTYAYNYTYNNSTSPHDQLLYNLKYFTSQGQYGQCLQPARYGTP